jgi:tripartite-type tricarboxylate transporter receptor subunit TctC
LLGWCCFAAQAQPWPAKPVRIVVAYPPGGGIDVMARQIADKLTAAWSQPVVVENRPGANTIVATDAVAKSAADGHSVLMTTDATFSINPHLYDKLPFDTQRDFVALKNKAGIDLVHVPYKGISLAVPAVMAGEVQLTFAGIATSSAPLKSGRIKPIAIGGAQRSALFPQVPTFSELGYPEVETHAWFGLFLPGGSPKEAVSRIHQDVKRILDEPDFRQKQLIDRGYDVVGSSPEEFSAYIKKDSESRARAVKISGAKAE